MAIFNSKLLVYQRVLADLVTVLPSTFFGREAYNVGA